MPTNVPVTTVAAGNIYTPTMYNNFLAANINKLLNTGHRVLTVAQFAALVSPEGTKGTVAPDEVYLEVDSANGIQWHLAFESGEPTYKWRYIGGPPMVSFVATSETTSSAAYAALATAGPSVAVPRSGDFDVATDALIGAPISAGVGFASAFSYDIGATGAVDGDAIQAMNWVNMATVISYSVARSQRKAGLTAITLTGKYKCTSGAPSATFAQRHMAVTPVRLI